MMRQVQKIVIGVLTAAMFSFTLSGCGTSQKAESGTEAVSETVSEPESKAEDLEENAAVENNETNVGNRIPDFSSVDLSGNVVTNQIFSQAELTVVNMWGTFCGPCIEEMPELAEWSAALPENVQIVGIVVDIQRKDDTEGLELANAIVEKAGIPFVNIIASDDFKELIMDIIGVPTTFFVDQDGNIVGEPIIGADVAGYKSFVEEYLDE